LPHLCEHTSLRHIDVQKQACASCVCTCDIRKCGPTQKHIETSVFVLIWGASSGTQSWLLGYLWFVLFPVHLVNAQALQRQGEMSFFFFLSLSFFFMFCLISPLCLKATIVLDGKGRHQSTVLPQMWVCMCM